MHNVCYQRTKLDAPEALGVGDIKNRRVAVDFQLQAFPHSVSLTTFLFLFIPFLASLALRYSECTPSIQLKGSDAWYT